MPKVMRVPSYRRHKPSGQAVVTLDGRDFYLGKYNSAASRAEYNRRLAEWAASDGSLPQTDGHYLAPTDATDAKLLDWANGFYDDCERILHDEQRRFFYALAGKLLWGSGRMTGREVHELWDELKA